MQIQTTALLINIFFSFSMVKSFCPAYVRYTYLHKFLSHAFFFFFFFLFNIQRIFFHIIGNAVTSTSKTKSFIRKIIASSPPDINQYQQVDVWLLGLSPCEYMSDAQAVHLYISLSSSSPMCAAGSTTCLHVGSSHWHPVICDSIPVAMRSPSRSKINHLMYLAALVWY